MHKYFTRLFVSLAIVALSAVTEISAARVFTFTRDTIILTDTIVAPDPADTIQTPVVPGEESARRSRNNQPEAEPRRARQKIVVPGSQPLPDKSPRAAVPWYYEKQLQNPFTAAPNYLDTTLRGFHMYDYAAADGFLYAHKGNVGHAYRSMHFSPGFTPGLRLKEYDVYGRYLFHHDEIKFFRPSYVFTDMFYLTGSNREQLFYATHNQKFHETFHMGMHYRVINSPGHISRMGARNSNFYLNADYLSPDKRYQALGSFIINRLRNMENAGLKRPLDYEVNRDMDSVFLYRAEAWTRELSVNLHQYYQAGYFVKTEEGQEDRFINLGRLNHNFSYTRTAFVLDDKAPPYRFYPPPYLNPESTYDSTAVHRLENHLSWSNFPLTGGRGKFPLNVKLYLTHSINSVIQPMVRPQNAPERDTLNKFIHYYSRDNFNSLVQGAELQTDHTKLISMGGYANATIGGYHDKDIHTGAYLNLGKTNRNLNLHLLARYSRTEAPYFYSYMTVNAVQWENHFDKMNMANLQAKLTIPFLVLEGNYFLLDKYVYLGRDAVPVQNNNEVGLFSLGVYNDIKLGFLGLRNHILVQKASSDNFERFPLLTSYHSAYADFKLFDGALLNQMGFDFHFNTGYQAMSYMPYIRGFFIQDEHTLPDKYLLDVFWDGKISNARLFVKYQNILGLVMKNRVHYDIPFYPLPETTFKFGVSWMFFN
jgi:hypothetical protein